MTTATLPIPSTGPRVFMDYDQPVPDAAYNHCEIRETLANPHGLPWRAALEMMGITL